MPLRALIYPLKAAGGFCSNPNRLDKDRQPEMAGSRYLGTKATHFDGELEGIALALEKHTNADDTYWPS